jgi:hypothetical protein
VELKVDSSAASDDLKNLGRCRNETVGKDDAVPLLRGEMVEHCDWCVEDPTTVIP